mgnify:CR=1 FL=1
MEHEPRGFETPAVAADRRDGLPRPARAGEQPAARVSAPIELAIVAEEAGRVCLPGPLFDVQLARRDARARRASRTRSCARSAPARRSSPSRGGTRPTRAKRSRRRTSRHGRVKRPRSTSCPFAACGGRAARDDGRGRRASSRARSRSRRSQTIDLAQRFGDVTLDHPATLDRAARACSSATDLLAAVGAGATLLGDHGALASRSRSATSRRARPSSGRSAPSRRFSTAWPTCCSGPSRRARRCTAPPGASRTNDPDDRARVRHREGLCRRRRAPRLRRGDPDARRHRLHVGARPALLLQAREDATRCTTARPRRSSIARARRGRVLT